MLYDFEYLLDHYLCNLDSYNELLAQWNYMLMFNLSILKQEVYISKYFVANFDYGLKSTAEIIEMSFFHFVQKWDLLHYWIIMKLWFVCFYCKTQLK